MATFSLVARDAATGDLGVVVASKFLGVGAVVPTAVAGVGAVATQSYANVSYGPRAIEALRAGGNPEDVAASFRSSDEGIEERQFGIVSADGASTTFTGSACHAWAGGVAGDGFAAQGNILAGEQVIEAMVGAFLVSDVPFPERLVAALAAGDAEGGDRRGRQSASLLVVGEAKGYGGLNDRWIDLRVDDHVDPVAELGRLLSLHRLYLDKPSGDVLELGEPEVAWLRRVLTDQGLLQRASEGPWDSEMERALGDLYGIENLEERWIGGPRVDPVAWRHLRARFGG